MPGSKANYRRSLVHDQNGKCFYCFLRMGDDATIEHFKSRSDFKDKLDPAINKYGNLRAAHSKCNSMVGNLPVEVKQRLHLVGKHEGSDAFFRELARVNRIAAKAHKKNKKEQQRAHRANVAYDYANRHKEDPAYAAALARLGPGIADLFENPVEPQQKPQGARQLAATTPRQGTVWGAWDKFRAKP